MRDVTRALLELLDSGEAGALATVVEVTGSVPQTPGARLLLCGDGRQVGTIGGGAVERAVLEVMQQTRERGVARVLAYDLTRDLGMCCGGSMKIFVEPIGVRPRLWLFGAGHVAERTAPLAASVGFEVIVVDEREEWNSAERFPALRRELTDGPSLLARGDYGERDWMLIVTHDHRLDEDTLRAALRHPARYVGLVGSRRKVYRLIERITARDGELDLSRVYAPVGLAVGAVGPAEIAVSIVAELVALRRSVGGAPHLRLASALSTPAPAPLSKAEAALATRGKDE